MPLDKNLKKTDTSKMTVREAGQLGGQKVRDLIQKGEELTNKKGRAA